MKHLTINKRLMLYFSFLTALPLVTFSLFSYITFSADLENMAVVHKLDSAQSAIDGIDIIKDRDEKVADQLIMDKTIQEALPRTADSFISTYERVLFINQINDRLAGMTDTYNISGIYAVGTEGMEYRSNAGIALTQNTPEFKALLQREEIVKSEGANIWLVLKENIFDLPTISPVIGKPFLYYIKNVNMLEDPKRKIGVALIQCKYDRFEKILRRISPRSGEQAMLVNQNGMILCHSSDKRLPGTDLARDILDPIEEAFESGTEKNGYFYTGSGDARVLYLYVKSGSSGWALIQSVPYPTIVEKSREYRNVALMVMCLCLVSGVALSFLFSKKITRPIVRLKDAMLDFGSGNLGTKVVDSQRKDELGQLQNSFNEMTEEIRKLVRRIDEEHAQNRKLELSMLEYQINPHFLYNTLDSINWMAQKEGNTEIGEMITALARFFRIGLNSGRELILIRHELEHARNYLILSKMRYKDSFDYDFRVDPALLDRAIPKIVLQPILENYTKHGLRKNRTDGFISVTSEIMEGMFVLKVEDNGKGISPQKLEKLRSDLAKETDYQVDSEGVGLINVDRRLKIAFGRRFGVAVESREGEGTLVLLKIPLN